MQMACHHEICLYGGTFFVSKLFGNSWFQRIMVPESNDEETSTISLRNTASDAIEELPNNLFNDIRVPEESICQEGYTQERVGILLTQPNNMDSNDQTTRKRQK
jgi:hypothetical protein